MISDAAQNEFLVRYYKWCLVDAVREFEQDFPLLKTVRGFSALAALDYLAQLPANDRLPLMTAKVRNYHRRALELLNDSPSKGEQELLANYSDNIMSFVGKYIDQYFSQFMDQSFNWSASPDRPRRVNKNRLAKLVKLSVEPICGKIVARDSTRLWTHLTTCEGWEIYTEIDMGGNRDLSYWHSIVLPGTTEALKNAVCFSSGLGLGGSEWTMLMEGDEAEAAQSIAALCGHFIAAAPGILQGLFGD